MEYTMHVEDEIFKSIKDGKKTIEMRLFDEKRKQFKTGDTIIFKNRKNDNTVRCKINNLYQSELSQDQDGIKSGLSWDQVGTKSGLRWDQAKKVLQLCMTERTLLEIMGEMQLTSRNKFRKNFVIPLLNLHLLERTVPDKPNSRNQKYRITSKGKEMLSQG